MWIQWFLSVSRKESKFILHEIRSFNKMQRMFTKNKKLTVKVDSVRLFVCFPCLSSAMQVNLFPQLFSNHFYWKFWEIFISMILSQFKDLFLLFSQHEINVDFGEIDGCMVYFLSVCVCACVGEFAGNPWINAHFFYFCWRNVFFLFSILFYLAPKLANIWMANERLLESAEGRKYSTWKEG